MEPARQTPRDRPVLVTGGTGFIGSRVALRLLAEGWKVRLLAREGARRWRHFGGQPPAGMEVWPGDIRDGPAVAAAAAGCGGVAHLAGLSRWDQVESAEQREITLTGMDNLLVAARVEGLDSFLFVSSVAALGPSEGAGPVQAGERRPLPVGLQYPRWKREAEDRMWAGLPPGCRGLVVFPGETYGAGDVDGVTCDTLRTLARMWPRLVPAGGMAVVAVEEVAAVVAAAWARGRSGGRYVAAGPNVTLAELGATVRRMEGLGGDFRTLPPKWAGAAAGLARWLGHPWPELAYAAHEWFADNGETREELGVEFSSLEAILRPALTWLRHNSRVADRKHGTQPTA